VAAGQKQEKGDSWCKQVPPSKKHHRRGKVQVSRKGILSPPRMLWPDGDDTCSSVLISKKKGEKTPAERGPCFQK